MALPPLWKEEMDPPQNQSGASLLSSMTKIKSLAEDSRQLGARYERFKFLIEYKFPLSQVTGCVPAIAVGTDAHGENRHSAPAVTTGL